MKMWDKYFTPASVDEAVQILSDFGGQAKIIAGGTDLLVEMKDKPHPPYPALIDVTRIPELTQIDIENGYATIGAAVTHTQIVKHPTIAAQATCLVESCGVIGGPQVRNVATLGGNVAHALPAADGTTSLIVLDTQAEVVHQGERKWLPLSELFLGAGKSLLDSTRDVLIRFRFPLSGAGEGTAFSRIMRPQGVALPILGCAVWVKVAQGNYEAARICIAPVAQTPTRANEVEASLVGQAVTETSLEKAISVALDTLHPRTSKYRATADYRREMIEVLLRRTLPLAAERARTGEAIPEGVGQ